MGRNVYIYNSPCKDIGRTPLQLGEELFDGRIVVLLRYGGGRGKDASGHRKNVLMAEMV